MAYHKKTWTDRKVEYPNRRIITDIDSGEEKTVTITRDEGEVEAPGDLLNAANLNDLENRIEAGINSGGGGGSTVVVEQIQTTGTKIAKITVDGEGTDLYAPNRGGSTVTVKTIQKSGNKLATITVNGVGNDLYSPLPPDPGTKVVANPSGTSSTNLAKVKIDDAIYNIPSGPTVVANPSGPASTDLNSLQVGNVIYDIPSGGGGTNEVIEALKYTYAELSREPYDEEYNYYYMYLDVTGGGGCECESSCEASLEEPVNEGEGDDEDPNNCSGIIKFYYNYDHAYWIFITTAQATDEWKIWWGSIDDEDRRHIIYQDSGLVTNKLIYVPIQAHFEILYNSDYPPSIKAPGATVMYS